jgi:hypothetical protein
LRAATFAFATRLTVAATGQNFLGVVFGDCTGNWTPPAPALQRVSGSQMRLGTPRRAAAGYVRIPLFLTRQEPTLAFDAVVHIDSGLRLVRVRKRALPRQSMVQWEQHGPEVRLAAAAAEPFSGAAEPVFVLEFAQASRELSARTGVRLVSAVLDEHRGSP